MNLVQGAPGRGKTTYILNNYKHGDLILFRRRYSTQEFRKRLRNTYPNTNKYITIDTFRTVHSFIINLTQHIKHENKYEVLTVDEPLKMHAGEILFAAILSGVREAIIVGDINKIPYINRTESPCS